MPRPAPRLHAALTLRSALCQTTARMARPTVRSDLRKKAPAHRSRQRRRSWTRHRRRWRPRRWQPQSPIRRCKRQCARCSDFTLPTAGSMSTCAPSRAMAMSCHAVAAVLARIASLTQRCCHALHFSPPATPSREARWAHHTRHSHRACRGGRAAYPGRSVGRSVPIGCAVRIRAIGSSRASDGPGRCSEGKARRMHR
jgi:hypothetical protein